MAHDEPVIFCQHLSSSAAQTLVLAASEINVGGEGGFMNGLRIAEDC